jgi:hypothetical protein
MTYCKCGQMYPKQWQIVEHIGICNPHWPRTSPDDDHIQVTEAEYMALHREAKS